MSLLLIYILLGNASMLCFLYSPRDALIVVSMDTITSILAGFPVFMTMGYLANQLQSSVDNVLDSGTIRL